MIRFAADAVTGDPPMAAPTLGQSWDTRILVGPLAVGGDAYDLPTGKPKLIGHMRNREYLPHLMRFAQRDPNATGQLVMAAVVHGGRAMGSSPSAMELMQLYGDGPCLYGYLAGKPRGNSDPTGLFFPSPTDLVGSAIMVGFRGLRGGLEGLTQQYAANMEDDIDWAMDWSRKDNEHSRLSDKWVGDSFMDGMYGGLEDGINDVLSDFSYGLWPEGGPAGPVMAGATPSAGGKDALAVAKIIVEDSKTKIVHLYKSGDHAGPTHFHVYSNGQRPTRIGPNGRPLNTKADRELTNAEKKLVMDNLPKIKKSIKLIQKWIRKQPWPKLRR